MDVHIIIRVGELSTKGRNKKRFMTQLAHNIRAQFKDNKQVKVINDYDFMFVQLNRFDVQEACARLENVFGIASFSPAYIIPRDFESLKNATIELINKHHTNDHTFKVATSRSDHEYEMDTNEINRELGHEILEAFPQLTVKMKAADFIVRVKVRSQHFVLSTEWIKGAGGLPVGSSGKGALMLSGGIDSPVAGYLAMKRGIRLSTIHFASPPYTSPQALDKTKRLAKIISQYGEWVNFIEVPFTEIQEEIKNKIPAEYLMTITRRMMMRLAERIAQDQACPVIINGESIGQVASQTLESMAVINAITTMPIVRPVVTMDKNEIIEIAHKIGTFETSIEPFEDCCTVFAPPSPKTKPKVEVAEYYEQRLDIEGLVERAFSGIKMSRIEYHEEQPKDEFDSLL